MRSLGYDRYGAGGGDFGAGIATFMALVDPGPLIGLHLTNLELTPYTGPGSRALSPPEQEYLGQARLWGATLRSARVRFRVVECVCEDRRVELWVAAGDADRAREALRQSRRPDELLLW